MKKMILVLLLTGIFMIMIGVGGFVITNRYNYPPYTESDLVNDYDKFSSNKIYGRRGNGFMMGNRRFSFDENEEVIELDLLIKNVENHIELYDEELIIGDIFIFEDSEYYFSIIEKETGKGAMELLVNQYTQYIYPEYGPNMMWNLKYGMHYTKGMMHGYKVDDGYFQVSNFSKDNEITMEKAYNEGTSYLKKKDKNLELNDKHHDFYGYYTFHVEKEGMPIGMLSVNGFTGDVWYHDWHGRVTEIIDYHDEYH